MRARSDLAEPAPPVTPVRGSLLLLAVVALTLIGARAAARLGGLTRPWAVAVGAAAALLVGLGAHRAFYRRVPSRRWVGELVVVWVTLLAIGWGLSRLNVDLW
jgi:hypothetical protein